MPKDETSKTQPGATTLKLMMAMQESVVAKMDVALTSMAAVIDAVDDRIAALEATVARLEKVVDGDLLPTVTKMSIQMYDEDDMSEGLILNVSQVAKVLGVSRPTVYRLVESGALPAKKLSTGSDTTARTVVLSEDLKAFLAGLPSAEGQPAS